MFEAWGWWRSEILDYFHPKEHLLRSPSHSWSHTHFLVLCSTMFKFNLFKSSLQNVGENGKYQYLQNLPKSERSFNPEFFAQDWLPSFWQTVLTSSEMVADVKLPHLSSVPEEFMWFWTVALQRVSHLSEVQLDHAVRTFNGFKDVLSSNDYE